MRVNKTIQMLIDISVDEIKIIESQIKQAIENKHNAQQRLVMLENHYIEYVEQLRLRLSQGLTKIDYNNYNQFLSNLSKLISDQVLVVQSNHDILELYQDSWKKTEHKRMKYNVLIERAKTNIMKHENKIEQKQSDEHSSILMVRKNSENIYI